MSAKAIREYHGKKLASRWLSAYSGDVKYDLEDRALLITPSSLNPADPTSFDALALENPWLLEAKLVVKPDQLIKRRGKAGLLAINKTWPEVVEWIKERMNKECKVEIVSGILDRFIVEPFVPHAQSDEYYICLQSFRENDEILFYHEGGVDVGDVDSKGVRLSLSLGEEPTQAGVIAALLQLVPAKRQEYLSGFIVALIKLFRDLNFVYMEINPLVMTDDGRITPLDMAAKIDETAHFLNANQWGTIEFPAPFGRAEFPEETFIKKLDMSSGSSLKLTILNQFGRVWTMVAGGGASVVYADTISDLGFGAELANYGEYSGAPSLQETYDYARTIFSLMCRHKDERGKVLIIGGGIANFTDVAATFTGIQKAMRQYREELLENQVQIWVRRAGPNYQEGLKNMRITADELGLPVHLYGPETHITAVVPLALGLRDASDYPEFDAAEESRAMMSVTRSKSEMAIEGMAEASPIDTAPTTTGYAHAHLVTDLTPESRSMVYGLQTVAVQGMLDFDFMCKRTKPSVACMVFPFSGNHYTKMYWGTEETLIPVYTSIAEAVSKHPDVTMMINFASFRSVYDTVQDTLNFSHQIKTIAIIAEGVPESQTRQIIKDAAEKKVGLIGPATVGGIKPGCFRIGNTGGMLDNIIMSKLYRPGSVAYVSKSGGMSNELNNIIARNSDGVYEGVAIGGDRYPGSLFLDHLVRYNDNPEVKMMVLLGEVGGIDEYAVAEAIASGRITKPLVAWVMGTCASIFPYEVQFGHAGAMARGDLETAAAKNTAMTEAGAHVPRSFDAIGEKIYEVYAGLIKSGAIVPKPEPPTPKIPMDYNWAKRLGLIRKPANFISSISDDRGDELTYAGMPISEAIQEDIGVGGVLSLLWFRRRLPSYATKFIEMVLMVSADHGPAVSGAHNTIVSARAGKDLVSSLCSGLLTIGPRFGGALDDAAAMFMGAVDEGVEAEAFVKDMRKQNKLIMGIGHKIRTITNPDMRVKLVKEYAQKHFPQTTVLDFALAVEQVTTKKKATLILNVDGCIAACFVDLLRSCGAFDLTEANELLANGCLNGLFVTGRTLGFIGHYIDQKRLKQGLYRHPWDDISYQTQL
ncbi:atp-citrate synthase [Ochromonadaceae sp. CCMP2298]|nr:atp-citrate synthase [Ochromonadaceae sp. CCMP2298]